MTLMPWMFAACGGPVPPAAPVAAPGSAPGSASPARSGVFGFSADPARRGRASTAIGATLAEIWSADVGIQGWQNSPVVVGDRVYVSSYGATWNVCDDADGVVVLERATGVRLGFWPTRCDANGLASDGEHVYTVTDEGMAFAWTVAGEAVFEVTAASGKLYAPPVPLGEGLLVSGVGTLALLDPGTGQERKRFPVAGKIRNHSVGGGRVYFGLDGGKVGWCSLAELGCHTFTVPGDGSDTYGAIAWDTDVYAIPGGYDGSAHQDQLALYRVADDTKVWGHSHTVGAKASPAITTDLVLFAESGHPGTPGDASWGGSLLAYERESGAERWAVKAHGGSWSSPVVAGDKVVWIPMSGTVLVLDLATGVELASWAGGQPVFATPAVVDGVIYVGTDAGTLVALSTR